jgi:uncharacterized membrane protein YqaE (UPF0057 family)
MSNGLLYEIGFLKYVVNTLLTLWGFISMYIFGSTLITLWAVLQTHSEGGNFIELFIAYFLTEYLPPLSVGEVVMQALLGALAAGLLWYLNMPKNNSSRR